MRSQLLLLYLLKYLKSHLVDECCLRMELMEKLVNHHFSFLIFCLVPEKRIISYKTIAILPGVDQVLLYWIVLGPMVFDLILFLKFEKFVLLQFSVFSADFYCWW